MKKREISLRYTAAIRMEDKIYFSASGINGLFRINLEDFSVGHIMPFYGYPFEHWHLHGPIAEYKRKLYFFPVECNMIHSYDLDTGLQEHVEFQVEVEREDGIYDRFYCSHISVRDSRVWMFSRYGPVFEFDMEDGSVKQSEKLSGLMQKYKTITNFVETPQKRLFTYSRSCSVLVEIDVENETVKEHSLKHLGMDIVSINYFDGVFWFIDGKSSDVCEWDMENQTVKKYVSGELEWIEGKREIPFGKCCFVNGKIYLIPGYSKNIMELDRQSGIISKAMEYPEDFCFYTEDFRFYTELKLGAFGITEVIGDKIWLHPWAGNRLIVYDTKSGEIDSKEVTFDLYDILDGSLLLSDGVVYEAGMYTLEYLCRSRRCGWQRSSILRTGTGKTIYEKISVF